MIWEHPRWLSGEESCQCKRCRRREFNPWVRNFPWRKKWQPTPIFFLGKSHRQRKLAGCSSWDLKEPHTAEIEHTHMCTLHDLCKWNFVGFGIKYKSEINFDCK